MFHNASLASHIQKKICKHLSKLDRLLSLVILPRSLLLYLDVLCIPHRYFLLLCHLQQVGQLGFVSMIFFSMYYIDFCSVQQLPFTTFDQATLEIQLDMVSTFKRHWSCSLPLSFALLDHNMLESLTKSLSILLIMIYLTKRYSASR